MSAPMLTRRLVLEAPERVADGAGGYTETWVARGTLWAEVVPRGAGREVDAAILVMLIDEVFDAKITPSRAFSSISLKILNFSSGFSVAASMTRLAYSTPSVILVNVVILFKVACLSASEIFSLDTILSKFLAMVDIPRLRDSSLISINCTLNPD